jgi:hypothetical protein
MRWSMRVRNARRARSDVLSHADRRAAICSSTVASSLGGLAGFGSMAGSAGLESRGVSSGFESLAASTGLGSNAVEMAPGSP